MHGTHNKETNKYISDKYTTKKKECVVYVVCVSRVFCNYNLKFHKLRTRNECNDAVPTASFCLHQCLLAFVITT